MSAAKARADQWTSDNWDAIREARGPKRSLLVLTANDDNDRHEAAQEEEELIALRWALTHTQANTLIEP